MHEQEDSIIALLESLGAREISVRNSEIRSTCPFHCGNNPTSLRVLLPSGHIQCFACGYNWNIYKLFKDRIPKPSGQSNTSVPITKPDISSIAEVMLIGSNLNYQDVVLLKRCNNVGLLEKIGVGVATSGPFMSKVVFPYRDYYGKLHGFKLRNGRNFSIENYCRIQDVFFMESVYSRIGSIIIVEGEWDAIRLYELGLNNVVAIGGSDLTNGKIDKLGMLGVNTVYLALDNDTAGRIKTQKIIPKLDSLYKVYDVRYDGKDPWETKSKYEFLMNIAKSIVTRRNINV